MNNKLVTIVCVQCGKESKVFVNEKNPPKFRAGKCKSHRKVSK